MSQNGKGDTYRKLDHDAYSKNWDLIFKEETDEKATDKDSSGS